MTDAFSQGNAFRQAAEYLAQARRLVIFAGAGMSADSGLPTFRDEDGLWRQPGSSQFELASYRLFEQNPAESWAFYTARQRRYAQASPHSGYAILRRWCEHLGDDHCFVFTSNVDGYFQRAGFPADRVLECHGSIWQHYCSRPECETRQSATSEAQGCETDIRVARCQCGAPLRPHVMMFGDRSFDHARLQSARARWAAFQQSLGSHEPYVLLEIGVGSTVTTVEDACWALSRGALAVIQINPTKPAPDSTYCAWIALNDTAQVALERLERLRRKHSAR
ncbi:SIR2 family NAD-dependent protein deacylase [Marinobacterium sediminicola]|uniref:protein acetyllysine N-acetyltransferase n=1 Tax=Marinobacterium sediminicola TaxID=518898 RepID=A0ABY1S2B6_9GAMM|nr:NAD-dependent deacetylase [Marinobacterium sediminicola]ULG68542.1 NAD-dependent deacetylase [Marinobacterium sediminicola]SMR76602.1 NAD-dependent protein deacetylase, SIR2 family [Marinobacterium sediminicola]